MSLPRTRKLTIIAQDPSVKDENGNILKAEIEIPAEDLEDGPCGHRVHVIDYDTSTATLYMPHSADDYNPSADGDYQDPFAEDAEAHKDKKLLEDPNFHAQNVYALVMRTLARFEFALGRRVSWGFAGHQIHVAPHAFADANAFYSERDQALVFGYFRSQNDTRKVVFTCLSHDVVVHETTHALLDGLRRRYTAPSTPEQAGFHEGFADVVSLLSVFSLPEIVSSLLDYKKLRKDPETPDDNDLKIPDNSFIATKYLTVEALKNSVLLGLAEEMGQEMASVRGTALRRSVNLMTLEEIKSENQKKINDFKQQNKRTPTLDELGKMELVNDTPYLERTEYDEPHRCGELFVAAMLNAFLRVWRKRIERLLRDNPDKIYVDRYLVVENAKDSAEQLLTMAIRALDYMPSTDMRYYDYLSALLTSDRETMPDDSRYGYRQILLESFRVYGLKRSPKSLSDGTWKQFDAPLCYNRTHFDSLLRDPDEIFRFLWDNRQILDIDSKAYTKVQSVRQCLRAAADGFIVRETVAEYVQMVTLEAGELETYNIGLPEGLEVNREITIFGGGTLIFNEYGQLKYHIRKRIFNQQEQTKRLKYLQKYGYFDNPSFNDNVFARMHLSRAMNLSTAISKEEF